MQHVNARSSGVRSPSQSAPGSGSSRQRNPRGEGHRLRDDILAAAEGLLEANGSEQAVTLRAVAREVGIATTSIYTHFPNREAIVRAVVDGAFVELGGAITQAATRATDPTSALVAGCLAYVEYGLYHPTRYRVLFDRKWTATTARRKPRGLTPPGEAVFGMLVQGIGAASPGSDAAKDATLLWLTLHGLVTLRSSTPWFDWPPVPEMVGDAVSRICLRSGRAGRKSPK